MYQYIIENQYSILINEFLNEINNEKKLYLVGLKFYPRITKINLIEQ